MYMLLQQTRRNLKIFLKDKANIFFSLLSPLIVLALYVLFLGRVQADGILASLEETGLLTAAAEEGVQAFCDAWMLAGCLSCACITVPLCACGLSVQDQKRGIAADLLASPVPAWLPAAAYFLSVLAAGLCISLAVLAVSFVWLAASGSWFLSIADVFGCLGALLLSVLSSSTLLTLLVRFVRSEGAFMGLNVIVGTVVGFLIGAYMPVSYFPKGVQYFTLFIPGSYSAGLFRNLIMGGSLDRLSETVAPQFAESLAEEFSLTFDFFGAEISAGGMAAVLAGTVVLFAAIGFLLSFVKKCGKNKKGRKEKTGGAVSR